MLSVALICDDLYFTQTLVAIESIIRNNKRNNNYKFYIIGSSLSQINKGILKNFNNSEIELIETKGNKFEKIKSPNAKSICVATMAALEKFDLPQHLKHLERVLYLDSDIIVRDDIADIFSIELNDNYAAAIVDSGSIYYKHKYVKGVDRYFNSGVMLLNLEEMRKNSVTNQLIKTKSEMVDDNLMDQNVFNVVFNNKVVYLPLFYNLLYVNLLRSSHKFTLLELNNTYSTNIDSLYSLPQKSKIIHFSSKEKPCKYPMSPLAEVWYEYFNLLKSKFSINDQAHLSLNIRDQVKSDLSENKMVSVIIPIYNTEEYLNECLNDITEQSLKNIEIICVNDGSTDKSLEIVNNFCVKDRRIKVINQKNAGQSTARNNALKIAIGEYIYFMDSDDRLKSNALEELYNTAKEQKLDVLLFNGESFFENKDLEKAHEVYSNYYKRNREYNGVFEGQKLYSEMVYNSDYKVSPCLQFLRKDFLIQNDLFFRDGIIHEDNLFSFQVLIASQRAAHLDEFYFLRRVREESTMTRAKNKKHFIGYYIVILNMMIYINKKNYDENTIRAMYRQIDAYTKTAKRLQMNTNVNEEDFLWRLNVQEKLLNLLLWPSFNYINHNPLNRELKEKEEEINCLINSLSFRMGRLITFLPRKARDILS